VHRGKPIGQLVVGARWGERRLPAADRAVLDLLATPLTVALRATSLSEELQASREELVTATAEERRRLHRELHDSLGPVLTGAALKADGAALAARADPERAERLATELADQLRQAIADVRRMVYGLRPPALDQGGLVAALRRQEGQLGDVDLTVTAPDPLPVLPAAVEVAAYRIATEAVTNVVRHAGAKQAVVALSADSSGLRVSVTDDGTAGDSWTPGVGLQSIEERVSEVGGRWEAGPTPAGGRLVAVLPLRVAP
jgi:signal transduction histidine kinase